MKILDKVELDEFYILSQINEIRAFSYFSDEERKTILGFIDVLEFSKNEKIINEGDIDPYFYGIIEGSVSVVKERKGKQAFISSIKKGEIFGEAAIFINLPRTANVLAEDKLLVIRIERKDLLTFIKSHSQSGIKMLMLVIHSLLKKLKEANQDLAFERMGLTDEQDIQDILDEYQG